MPVLGACQADVYSAEHESIGRLGVRWTRLADARAHLDGLISSAWFAERWPHLLHCGVERRGSGSVWSVSHPLDADGPGGLPSEGVVLVADGGLTQPVVLHELAHLLAGPEAGHGPDFVRVHLALVRHDMGFDAYAGYRAALARTGSFPDLDGLG